MDPKLKMLADLMVNAIRPLKKEIRALHERVKELEAAPFDYKGTHETGRGYSKNAVVTYDGSLWIALRSTTQPPGPGDSWQLCVKRGRDAR
jgi:hypothetical protein